MKTVSRKFHTLVLGSGAAGLAAAVRLRAEGVEDVAVLSEGLSLGTSINAGSDKQTYYKIGLYGTEPDSPAALAQTYRTAGSTDGRLALTEASLSARAFFHLVNLGLPFPHDSFGQYVGYKTDHDPLRRATSCGPYTSREMCRALIRQARRLSIPILEDRCAVKLVVLDGPDLRTDGENRDYSSDAAERKKRVCGLIAINRKDEVWETYFCENLIFAVGGPGGLYDASVYPTVQFGAIGLALEIGAEANSLPESQFGLASQTEISDRRPAVISETASQKSGERLGKTENAEEIVAPASVDQFRWNVSGTYMQVLPRFISTEPDGVSGPREFLRPYFASDGEMNGFVFLKGYQWPFDVRKVRQGSSMIDLAVFYETAIRGRRVFLDFRTDPADFRFDDLPREARTYLEKSGGICAAPIARLAAMNPDAVRLYRDHGIDLAAEPLEIHLCAQHNNGGLTGNIWFESSNILHLFPIGEVNGSHGVARPGGSALNAGQVGAFRAAEFIARRYSGWTVDLDEANRAMKKELSALTGSETDGKSDSGRDWPTERKIFQKRMTRYAAHFRSAGEIRAILPEAHESLRRCCAAGITESSAADAMEILRNRQLALAVTAYLSAILYQIESGVGSRGSAVVVDPNGGTPIHPLLPEDWRIQAEDETFREKILYSCRNEDGTFVHQWRPAPEIPTTDEWFENVWRDDKSGRILD